MLRVRGITDQERAKLHSVRLDGLERDQDIHAIWDR